MDAENQIKAGPSLPAGAEGMAGAGIVYQIGKAGIAGAAKFAGVFGLFAAFLHGMFALAGAKRMEEAEKLRQLDLEVQRLGLKREKKHEFLCVGLGWDFRTSAKRLSRLRQEFRN